MIDQQLALPGTLWAIEVGERCLHGRSCPTCGGTVWRQWRGFVPSTDRAETVGQYQQLVAFWPTRTFRVAIATEGDPL